MYASATKFAYEIERYMKVHEEEKRYKSPYEKKMMPKSACEKKDA